MTESTSYQEERRPLLRAQGTSGCTGKCCSKSSGGVRAGGGVNLLPCRRSTTAHETLAPPVDLVHDTTQGGVHVLP